MTDNRHVGVQIRRASTEILRHYGAHARVPLIKMLRQKLPGLSLKHAYSLSFLVLPNIPPGIKHYVPEDNWELPPSNSKPIKNLGDLLHKHLETLPNATVEIKKP